MRRSPGLMDEGILNHEPHLNLDMSSSILSDIPYSRPSAAYIRSIVRAASLGLNELIYRAHDLVITGVRMTNAGFFENRTILFATVSIVPAVIECPVGSVVNWQAYIACMIYPWCAGAISSSSPYIREMGASIYAI